MLQFFHGCEYENSRDGNKGQFVSNDMYLEANIVWHRVHMLTVR